MANDWHIPELNVIEKEFNTDLSEGLSGRDARARLAEKNKNAKPSSLFVEGKRSAAREVLTFVGAPLAILLLIVALLTAILGGRLLGLSVLAVAIASLLFGGFMLLNSTKRLEAMKEFSAPMVKVKRGGHVFYTDGRNLVRGDVILLAEGDLLTCDARIISSDALVVEELYNSADGVQSRRAAKSATAEFVSEAEIKSPDAENMLYAGSAVMSGEATAVVCDTDREVYLASFVPEGALGGKDTEPALVKDFKPIFHRITFISVSLLLILSLLGLLTLNGEEPPFIYVFLMLLSSIYLLTDVLLSCGAKVVISSYIKRLSVHKSLKRMRDNSAAVRNVKALDALTGVTDLLLVGKAGLCCGEFKIASAYTSFGPVSELTCETKGGDRLLKYIHTYVKAQREGSYDNEFRIGGYSDALFAHLKNCGYDISGASIAIKSLYFASDVRSGRCYACAETENEMYRTAIVTDKEILERCALIYDGGTRAIEEEDVYRITDFCRRAEKKGGICLYVISEKESGTVFEGVIVLEHKLDSDVDTVMPELIALNVKTTVLLYEEDEQTTKLLSDPKLSQIFCGNIAYASNFRKSEKSILEGVGQYCAYVGFTNEEYCSLVSYMRKNGARIAAYGVCNDYNAVMARADIAVSCDVLNYASVKYRESLYEKLPPEGRETSVRASQRTRLLAKVIVKRAHDNGGGLYSVMRAIKMSRCAYVSLAQSMLLFAFLMSELLTFSLMSVLTGTIFLDPLMSVSLASVFALLSLTVFTNSEQKGAILSQKRDFTKYSAQLLHSRFSGLAVRVGVVFVVSLTVSILGAVGVFGERPTYTLPIYICLLLTLFAEVFMINRTFTKKGEGRSNCWLKVLVSYGLLLGMCAVSTQSSFAKEFFKNGWGSREYFIILGYAILYVSSLFVLRMIDKKRNIKAI